MEAIKWPDKHFRLAATVLQKVTQGLGFLASSAPSLVLSLCVHLELWHRLIHIRDDRKVKVWSQSHLFSLKASEAEVTTHHFFSHSIVNNLVSIATPSCISHCKTLAGRPWVHCELNYCKGDNGFGWEISNFCQREYRKIKWAPIIIKAWRPNVDVTGRFYSANLSVQFNMHNEIKCFREMIWIC